MNTEVRRVGRNQVSEHTRSRQPGLPTCSLWVKAASFQELPRLGLLLPSASLLFVLGVPHPKPPPCSSFFPLLSFQTHLRSRP